MTRIEAPQTPQKDAALYGEVRSEPAAESRTEVKRKPKALNLKGYKITRMIGNLSLLDLHK